MSFITINKGGDAPEGWKDGVYPVILTAIEGPRTITAQTGTQAGQDIDLLDWTFAIESGPFENVVFTNSTSTITSPRSKLYAFLSALLGHAPAVGERFEKEDIIGRSALATINLDDRGWLKITNLSAMPTTTPAPEPAAAAPTPLREQATEGQKLPF